MSVLIKGIDLPEAYTSAWLTVFECVGEHTFMKTYKVSAEQIQAIPPHGRLVDADELAKTIKETCLLAKPWDYVLIERAIADAPTIIEAEEGEDHD